MRQMLIPISSLKETSKNGATLPGAPNANPLTKSATHAPRANHDKGLTKTAKNYQKNTFSKIAHSAKVL